jgi:hypothetical protein
MAFGACIEIYHFSDNDQTQVTAAASITPTTLQDIVQGSKKKQIFVVSSGTGDVCYW